MLFSFKNCNVVRTLMFEFHSRRIHIGTWFPLYSKGYFFSSMYGLRELKIEIAPIIYFYFIFIYFYFYFYFIIYFYFYFYFLFIIFVYFIFIYFYLFFYFNLLFIIFIYFIFVYNFKPFVEILLCERCNSPSV